MNDRLSFAPEPFAGNTELEEFGTLDLETLDPWQREAGQDSLQRVRWIQESLNKILKLQLRVDGIMGPGTRSAIRSFQQKRKLFVDGIVGSATIRALISAGAAAPPTSVISPDLIVPAAARLEGFDFDKSELKPSHISDINKIADKIVASWRSGKPFFTVRVVGHTDPEGTAQHNQALGLRRALAVRTKVQNALKAKQRDLYYKVLVLASSKGEYEPIDVTNTPQGQARNRRVEVFLSTKMLLPLPKPKPPVIELPPIIETATPPRTCNPDDLNRRLAVCETQIRGCMKKCETDMNYWLNKVKDMEGIAECLALRHPLAVTGCALIKGGVAAKEAIDEYFRLSGCRDDCKRMLDICRHSARVNSGCLTK